MKEYIKGALTGFTAAIVLTFTATNADNLDVILNKVRINIGGVDRVSWGENIDVSDGEQAPASILYNGTTYLPMRKIGEWSRKKVYWNGDSGTVSFTGTQRDVVKLAEKPDKYGNMWIYYTFLADDPKYNHPVGYLPAETKYLAVKDIDRGYERVYRIQGNVRVDDDAIYFMRQEVEEPSKYSDNKSNIYKLSFDNDENTQDGVILAQSNKSADPLFIEDYIFFSEEVIGTTHPYTNLCVISTSKKAGGRCRLFRSHASYDDGPGALWGERISDTQIKVYGKIFNTETNKWEED